MRYYIKPVNTNDVGGPFEIEELNQRVRDQLIDSNWLAPSDLGEPIDSLRQSQKKDWFWIAEVPGIVGVARLKQTLAAKVFRATPSSPPRFDWRVLIRWLLHLVEDLARRHPLIAVKR